MNTENLYYIGFWRQDKYHGYGKMINADGSVQQGLWESTPQNSVFRQNKEDITSYNPDTLPEAMPIDLDHFEMKEYDFT